MPDGLIERVPQALNTSSREPGHYVPAVPATGVNPGGDGGMYPPTFLGGGDGLYKYPPTFWR